MATKSYMDLEVWKESRLLVKEVYVFASELPNEEKFGLSSQLKRAVISIPSNIAEGIGRNTSKDTLQFLFIAKGSLYEVETLLYLILDLELIKKSVFEKIIVRLETVRKLLLGFIAYKQKTK